MKMHWIEVDDKIWEFLKKHAEPFEDTPNSVLTRLLFRQNEDRNGNESPSIKVSGLPKSLAHVLEVISEIAINGFSRTQATRLVAERNNTVPTTIMDKYCRQLKLKAHDVDELLKEPDYSRFIGKLKEKFPEYNDVIETYFDTITMQI
jgi:hypothetical protein